MDLDMTKIFASRAQAKKASRRRRHAGYTPEIARLICDRVVAGESLRQICQDTSMPARSTVFVWLEEYEDFAAQYRSAKGWQIEDLLDQIFEITDSNLDRMEAGNFDPASFRQAKRQIAARKQLVAKLRPKKFSPLRHDAFEPYLAGMLEYERTALLIQASRGYTDRY
jgi:ribosome-binding protein aMBF1 (putative translation factor)